MSADAAPLAAGSSLAAPLAMLGAAVPERPRWFIDALAHEPARRWHVVQGARIETLSWGARGKPGLLLLHGKMAHADWWSFIAPFFAGTHRVVAPSFGGMGGSDWRSAYSMQAVADEAMAAAEHEGLFDAATPPVVVGHSFGGFVSLLCAQLHGARLGGVFTLDMPLMSREQRAARTRPGLRSFTPRPTKLYPTLQAALARFRFAPEQPCDNLYIADHIARTSLKTVRADDGSPAWTWRFDPRVAPLGPGNPAQALREAACPVAIGWGTDSALVTPPVAAYACDLAGPQAPRVPIAAARHHVMVDQPLALVDALRELLRRWPAK
ncbi:MAG: alpha/beta hydrolase [Burkholderiaceae bacterium]|nr:alpha/beta hydrolase [Burkholderiaceae bacterium]